MQLSTINSKITSGLSEVKNRVQTNWKNLSTTAKVATVASSIILAAGAVAAAVFGHLGVAALAIGGTLGAAIVHGTTAALGALGLIVPSATLLKSPKVEAKIEQAPVVVAAPVVEETVVVATPVVEAPVVAPSRLIRAKNASVAFVQTHPRKIMGAAAAIALVAGIRHAGFTSQDMSDLRRLSVMGLNNVLSGLEKHSPVSLNF